jgi:hypothetical protein
VQPPGKRIGASGADIEPAIEVQDAGAGASDEFDH